MARDAGRGFPVLLMRGWRLIMDVSKRGGEAQGKDSQPRAPYTAPKLAVYGPVAAVTAGGSRGKGENKGHPFSRP